MKYFIGMALGCLVWMAAGCQQFVAVDTPDIQVQEVRVTERTDQGVRVEVTVVLSNPNEIPLPLVHASYRVALEDLGVFALGDETHRTLPSRGSQTVVLPAAFAGRDVEPRGLEYRVSGTVQYQPPGQIRRILTETGIPLPSTHFQAAGRLE